MENVDWVGHRGLGPWIRRRRVAAGLTQDDVIAAAGVTKRTLQRYEADAGLGYETLRILDAIGITLCPAPVEEAPASLNREVRDLRHRIEALENETVRANQFLAEILDELQQLHGEASPAGVAGGGGCGSGRSR